jgi:dienelactone hydrolase
MRKGWIGPLASVALCVVGGWQADALPPAMEPLPELRVVPAPAGLVRLTLPAAFAAPDGALPFVVLIPDVFGEDGRDEPYAEALLSRGIAVLALGLDEPGEREGSASAAAAARVVFEWVSRDPRLDPTRAGLLGFGAGARAALEGGVGRPVVTLYPGCRHLDLAEAGPALILYGAMAEDAEACAVLPVPPRVELRSVPGAGHGWDAVGTLWLAGMLLPDPAGGGPLRAIPNPRVTLEQAEVIARHFQAGLDAPGSSGR